MEWSSTFLDSIVLISEKSTVLCCAWKWTDWYGQACGAWTVRIARQKVVTERSFLWRQEIFWRYMKFTLKLKLNVLLLGNKKKYIFTAVGGEKVSTRNGLDYFDSSVGVIPWVHINQKTNIQPTGAILSSQHAAWYFSRTLFIHQTQSVHIGI